MNSILQDFLKNVENDPNALAVKCENEELSYEQLDDLSTKIAIYLSDEIRKTDEIIPIYLNKSPIVVACMFACWKLGLAYSIIDKSTPIKRAKTIFNKLESSIIIDDKFISSFYSKNHTNNKFYSNKKLFSKNSLNELAAIIFTSGSTGIPKGVMLSHRNFSFMPLSYYEIIDENTKFLNLAGLSFILSSMATFTPLSKGSSTHIVKEDKITNIEYLSKYIKENNIDHAIFVPQLAQIFLKHTNVLKTMLVAGDINSNIYNNKTTIYNGFGQSETGGMVIYFKIDKSYTKTPIGKPFKCISVYLLDENEKLIREMNIIGEICVSGDVALGYYKDEKLTKEKFILNSFSKSDNDKILLKTGDLAYYNKNFDLVYYQRKDFMVNIYGYRVEPTEVEQALLKVDGISKSVVSGFDASKLTGIDNDMRLYAGYMSNKLINEEFIKDELKKFLPNYMVPSVIEKIDNIPLNDRGKVDRKNLIPYNIYELFRQVKEIIKPSNDLEQEIFDICTEILDYSNFGVTNSLMSIGFTSLSMIKMLSKIFDKYHVQINSLDIIEKNYNIQDISKKIMGSKKIIGVKNQIKEKYSLPYHLYLYYNYIKSQPSDSTVFNISINIEFGDDFDVFKLKDAIIKTIEINNYIKASFIVDNGKIYQQRNDDYQVDIKIHDEELTENIKKEFVKPFNIFEPPLFRFEIYQYNNGQINLLMDIHHILADAYSINMFFDDLLDIYFNNDSIKKDYDYFDYSIEYRLDSYEINIKKIIIKNLKNFQDINDIIYVIIVRNILYYIILYLIVLIKSLKNVKIEIKEFVNNKGNKKLNGELKNKIQIKEFYFNKIKINSKQHNFDDLILASIMLSLTKLINTKDVILPFIFHGRDNAKYLKTFGMIDRGILIYFNIDYDFSSNYYANYIKKTKNSAIKNSIKLIENPQVYFEERWYFHQEYLKKSHNEYLKELKYGSLYNQKNIKLSYNYISPLMNNDQLNSEILLNDDEVVDEKDNLLYFTVAELKDGFMLQIKYSIKYYSNEEIDKFIKNFDIILLKLSKNNGLEKLNNIMNTLH
ncbi:MAG: AMP-binding protein [Methanobrevibacter sp.]|jgi:acyl-coenzyme A synthetase/AMP-(fatty) acid ligase|nr:AMP-binding protein [Methanobrevibacter sp.]